MKALGIDVGSLTTKVVILDDDSILASSTTPSGDEAELNARVAMEQALSHTGLSFDNNLCIVSTGVGGKSVSFSQQQKAITTCLARGTHYLFPSVRMAIDMGAESSTVIKMNERGRLSDWANQDKCAAGTGRFLEMIAEVLNIPLEDSGNLALESKTAIPFNTMCAVFAKSEAISYLRQGVAKSDILAGPNEAIAIRCLNLLKRVVIEKEFSITGGIAKNKGMVAKLKEKVGLEPLLCEDPQIIGALGAALFAKERCDGRGTQEEIKVHYGYSDGTGDYFITIDTGRCDGCGKCVRLPGRNF